MVSIISFTENGDKINNRAAELFEETEQNGKTFNPKRGSIAEWTKEAFSKSDTVIFIGAVGIAVRAIATFIEKKDIDPAVIVIDEKGQFVIPILSGHIGGGNRIAKMIAEKLKASAIITTATDINGVFAVDLWAAENGYSIYDTSEIKHISAALLRGENVGLASDFKIVTPLPEQVILSESSICGICISDKIKKPYPHTLNLIPKRYVIGAGSRKGASENALIDLWGQIKLPDKAVRAVATIDIKKNEKSILRLAEKLSVPLLIYSAEELNEVKGDFISSEFVKKVTGTDNVCERSAAAMGGRIIINKTKGDGVTIAVAENEWSVSFENINGRC